MSRIAVVGGTGYAGSHIVAEAVSRGHEVIAVSRHTPENAVEGARYIAADVRDVSGVLNQIGDVDVLVQALSPRGDMAGRVRQVTADLFAALGQDTRLAVVGGAGGSLVAEGGPRVIDAGFPEEFKAEALEAIAVLDDLQADTSGKDWFFVHPAGSFGAWAPGERTGTYRTGGDVIVTNDGGESVISGADLGVAFLDEIEDPKHSRQRFTVGY